MTRIGGSIIMLCAFSLAALGLVLSTAGVNATARKFCSVVTAAAIGERQKLGAYDSEPPTTAAGAAQQREVRESLERYETLGRELGCPARR